MRTGLSASGNGQGGGRGQEDPHAQGKGACEAAAASWPVLKLGLELQWAGVPPATAQGPSLRVPSFLLQTLQG